MNELWPDCDKHCPDFWDREICGLIQRGWCNDPTYNAWVRRELGWDKHEEFAVSTKERNGGE